MYIYICTVYIYTHVYEYDMIYYTIYQHLYRYRVPKLTEGEALRCMERDPVQVGWRGGLWFLPVNCDDINVVHDFSIYIYTYIHIDFHESVISIYI